MADAHDPAEQKGKKQPALIPFPAWLKEGN
jgi:hypothetical protein